MADPSPPKLDYEGRDPNLPPRNPLAPLMAGILSGAALVGVLGFLLTAGSAGSAAARAVNREHFWPGIEIFGAIAAVAGTGVALWAAGERRKTFLAGLLLSVAILSLVEGMCFYAM